MSNPEERFTLTTETEGHTLELSLGRYGVWIYLDGSMGDVSSTGITPAEVDQVIENLTRLKNAFLARKPT
jgi:hypothetical protein